jgi:hypothetical protein
MFESWENVARRWASCGEAEHCQVRNDLDASKVRTNLLDAAMEVHKIMFAVPW